LSIIRYNLIVFEQDFAYASEDIDKNVKDTLDVIFAYVDKDVEDNVASKRIRNIFNVEVERNVDNVCEITFNNKNRFVKVVSMHTIANTNILEKELFASNVEGVSMLIIVKRFNIELDFARAQM
jgi:uncharacterized protein YqfA (UPF0365 family)